MRDTPAAASTLSPERAEFALRSGGTLTIDRSQGIARYVVPRPLSHHELLHPYLAPAAAAVAHWSGRVSLHAGAFVADGGVWGIVGAREAGKSSTLAWLALHGHPVVTDDVLVLEASVAFAGPRSVDLRRDTADRLGAGTSLGLAGARPRWRVPLAPIDGDLPLRGWIFLDWGTALAVRRLRGSTVLTRLIHSLVLPITTADPAAMLALAELPAYELCRRRDWRGLATTTARLLDVTREAP